jgi:hypothetical protein
MAKENQPEIGRINFRKYMFGIKRGIYEHIEIV